MKKNYFILIFFISLALVINAQTFEPTVGKWYSIIQKSSGLAMSNSPTNQPSVFAYEASNLSQAYTFIPTTYGGRFNVKNAEEKYVGQQSFSTTLIFYNNINDAPFDRIEFELKGTATSFRFLFPYSSKYIGSGKNAPGSFFYCDKPETDANGEFELKEVADPRTGLKQLSASIKTIVVEHNLTVIGADNYAVFNLQGSKVADVKINNANTHIALNSGIYFVKFSDGIQKIIVK